MRRGKKIRGLYLRIFPNTEIKPDRAHVYCRQVGPYPLVSSLLGIFFNYKTCISIARLPWAFKDLVGRLVLAALTAGVPPADKISYKVMAAWSAYFKSISPNRREKA
ncbi:MAG: hypothetical protein QXI84_10240 [Thermofilaceae archaeon]